MATEEDGFFATQIAQKGQEEEQRVQKTEKK